MDEISFRWSTDGPAPGRRKSDNTLIYHCCIVVNDLLPPFFICIKQYSEFIFFALLIPVDCCRVIKNKKIGINKYSMYSTMRSAQ